MLYFRVLKPNIIIIPGWNILAFKFNIFNGLAGFINNANNKGRGKKGQKKKDGKNGVFKPNKNKNLNVY